MKRLVGILIILIVLSIGCTQKKQATFNNKPVLKEPPQLTVSFNKRKINALRGTYSWNADNGDGTSTGFEKDSESPPKMVKSQNESLTVPAESSVTLKFNDNPIDYQVIIWQDDKQTVEFLKDGKIIMPKQKGLVVYEVYAEWKEGTAHYAFSILVA